MENLKIKGSNIPYFSISKEDLILISHLDNKDAGRIIYGITDFIYEDKIPNFDDNQLLGAIFNKIISTTDRLSKAYFSRAESGKTSAKNDKCDYKSFIKECRKERLNNRTYSELRFKDLLENNKISFQEEVIIDANCDKSYIVDFLVKGNIVVEIDGGYHSTEEQKEKDEIRDKNLKARGFNVIRIKNEELDNNEYIEDILTEIKHIRSKHPKLRIKKKNVKTKEVKKPQKPIIFSKVRSAYDIP